jgi:hypothetical protein
MAAILRSLLLSVKLSGAVSPQTCPFAVGPE